MHEPQSIQPATDSQPVPTVSLLGPGFLSRVNLIVGWSMTWRVAIANGLVSGGLQTVIILARGDLWLDTLDRALLLGATSIASLLLTDWVGRRVARRRYRLTIREFIGFAIIWREAVASLIVGGVGGLLAGVGLAVIHRLVAEGLRTPLTICWLVILAPVAVTIALGGAGWAAHRVFLRESRRPTHGAQTAQTEADMAVVKFPPVSDPTVVG